MEERGGKIALHREKSGHDGGPMMLGGVDLQLLVGGLVADERCHLLMLGLFVHDDGGPALVGPVDRDGVVLLQVFESLSLLARDVGWRNLRMG